MEFGLYEKIIREVSKFRYKTQSVHLHGFGEPLLDGMLPERIKLAKSLGIKETHIITNASLLTSEKSKQIIEAGLDSMRISFYGTSENEYNIIMKGLNFATTFENVKTFLKIRRDLKKNNPRIQINHAVRGGKTSELKKPGMIFDDLIDRKIGDTIVTTYLHNYGEGRDYNHIPSKKIISLCRRPWYLFQIRYDGKVGLCCFDYDGNQVMGDLNRNSIEDIWNSQDFARVRLDFKSLNYQHHALCLRCDQLRRS
jgi:MoaA/NifB/PqqE/SkfB family radical SAM enzyme